MLLATLLAVHGAWDAAPMAWRITNANAYTNDYSWYVRELEVYSSPDCTGEPIPASQPLGSKSTAQQKFIMDGATRRLRGPPTPMARGLKRASTTLAFRS